MAVNKNVVETKNYFEELFNMDVGDKIEQKNGLSYVSWAWCWAELKKKYPMSYYTVYERDDGCIYWTDGKTCWVKTGVTVVFDNGQLLEHIEYLPIMDFKNKSIPLANIDSMAVNKSIQRSLTKACARHGVGLYVYAGEDLPEEASKEAAVLDKARAELIDLCKTLCGKGLRDDVYKTLEKVTGNKNPNAIVSVEKANEAIEALKAML